MKSFLMGLCAVGLMMTGVRAWALTSKLNFHRSKSAAASQRPILVLVPGGGAFSGESWGPVDTLLRSFDVVTVDPPGTGKSPKAEHYDYESVIESIERELNTLKRPLVLAGISFGATYAADLATRGKYTVAGFVGFAAPITNDGLTEVGKSAETNPYRTQEMKRTEDAFDAKPNESTWRSMLAAIVPIYFTEPFIARGQKLILGDRSEFKSYVEVFFPYAQGKVKTDLVARLKKFTKPKIFIAGGQDRLVQPALIQKDARALSCQYELIPEASHFVLFEQPEKTTQLFEKYFS